MIRTTLFLLAVTTASSCLFAQTTKNPFSELGYKKQITYTSSKGEFEEFHNNADIVEIGSVYFNTKTNKVVSYINEEKENAEVATATSAMSVDPLCEKYYWISPYAYCLNNPVNAIDPDGKKVVIVGTAEYRKQVMNDLKQIAKDNSDVGRMVNDLIISPNTHIIEMPKGNEGYNYTSYNEDKAENGIPQDSKVGYDPNREDTKSGDERTPRVGLAHELKHSSDLDKGKLDTETKTETGVPVSEVDAINTENKIRDKTGDKKRTTYEGKKISKIWLDN